MTKHTPKEKADIMSEASHRAESRPGEGLQSAIGQRLKAYYDDVANEPVPDRFLSLLDALDAADASTNGREND